MQSNILSSTLRILTAASICCTFASGPSNASDFITSVEIDCYHSDLSNTESSASSPIEYYRNGKVVETGSVSIDEGAGGEGCSWGSSDPWSYRSFLDQPADEFRIYAGSSDAAFLDEVVFDRGFGTDKRFGRDNGMGWCLSTDPNDHLGSWRDYVDPDFGCLSCIRFVPEYGVYACPEDENPKELALWEFSTKIDQLTIESTEILSFAIDIAPVDHDGNGVDEIAALVDLGPFQVVYLYETNNLSGRALIGMFPIITDAIAIAGVDHDGNGIDEIAVLKDENADLNLYIYEAPIGPANPVQVGANYWGLPDHGSYNIAGVDANGDGIDEIAVLKNEDGDRNLYIYRAPIGTQNTALVGTNKWSLPDGRSFAITGVDHDGDGIDEIGVLKNRADPFFEIYEAPIGTQNSPLISSDSGSLPYNALALAGVDHDGDGVDAIAIIRY